MIRADEGWTALHAIAWIATRSDEMVGIVTDQLFMNLKIGPGNAAIAEKSLRVTLDEDSSALSYHSAHGALLAAMNTASISGWVGPDANVWFGNLGITGLSFAGSHVGFKLDSKPSAAWSSVLLAADMVRARWPADKSDLKPKQSRQPAKRLPPPEAATIQTSSAHWPLIVHSWRKGGASFWDLDNQSNWPRDRGDSIFLGRAVLMLGRAMFGDQWNDEDPARPMAMRGDQDGDRSGRWARVKAVFDKLGIAGEEGVLVWRHKPSFDTPTAPKACPPEYLRCERFEHLFYECRIDPTNPFRVSIDPHAHSHHVLFVDRAGLQRLIGELRPGSPVPVATPKAERDAPRRGRRPKWDWDGMMGELARIADEDGLDSIGQIQADVERWAARWFEARSDGESPAEGDIRRKVAPVFQARDRHNRSKAGN